MAKVHVLRNMSNKHYEVVVHADMPAGTNAVGHTWKDVWVADSKNVTRMAVGTAPGQITAAEANQIKLGTMLEFSFTILAESGGQPPQGLDAMADRFIAEKIAELQDSYKYYGYTH